MTTISINDTDLGEYYEEFGDKPDALFAWILADNTTDHIYPVTMSIGDSGHLNEAAMIHNAYQKLGLAEKVTSFGCDRIWDLNDLEGKNTLHTKRFYGTQGDATRITPWKSGLNRTDNRSSYDHIITINPCTYQNPENWSQILKNAYKHLEQQGEITIITTHKKELKHLTEITKKLTQQGAKIEPTQHYQYQGIMPFAENFYVISITKK